MFLHWLVGILCAFYFASFVLLLREVLRPGVLWFLRNLNDPDFNPVQEVPTFSVIKYLSRCFIYILLTDDTSTYPTSSTPICRIVGHLWNHRLLDALGTDQDTAERHAQFSTLLHRQLHVTIETKNILF